MVADIVPIGLGLDERDVFTLWAPRYREAGDEWEAFLGKDDDLYAFESVPDLVAFVRVDTENDLTDHPNWPDLTTAGADKLDPADDKRFDLIDVYEILAEDPNEEAVVKLAATLALVQSLGSVCELPAVTKFFNGNPVLATVSGGIDNFSDKVGKRRWDDVGAVVERGWDKVIDAIEELISTPDVDEAASKKAETELEELRAAAAERKAKRGDAEDEDEDELDAADSTDESADEEEEEEDVQPAADDVVLGSDEDFWLKVGIDPIQLLTSRGSYYTLRCYLDDTPIFLGRNGRISVFSSERQLARYLADEHDHDLSDLATYDDIRTAATDGSLKCDVSDENVYVLTGLADDLADGPEAIDRDQLELVVELLRDVGDYSEDSVVKKTLDGDTPLAAVVGYVLDPDNAAKPKPPYAKAVEQWTELETFVESRLRQE